MTYVLHSSLVWLRQLKPYVAHNSPKPPKVAPPSVDDLVLNLESAEIDIMDIIAPQHKKLREQRREKLFGQPPKEEENVESAQ